MSNNIRQVWVDEKVLRNAKVEAARLGISLKDYIALKLSEESKEQLRRFKSVF